MSRQTERSLISNDELEFIQAVGRNPNTPSSSNTFDKINAIRRRQNRLPLSRSYFDKVLHAGGCRDIKTVFGFKIKKWQEAMELEAKKSEQQESKDIQDNSNPPSSNSNESDLVPVTTEKVEVKMEPLTIKDSQLTSFDDEDVMTILKYIVDESTDIRINTIKARFKWGYPRLMKVYKILEKEGIITTPQKKREERKVDIDVSFIKDIIKDVMKNKEEIEEIKIKSDKLQLVKNIYTSFIYILDGLGMNSISKENLRFKQRNISEERFNLVIAQAIHAGVIKYNNGVYEIEPYILRQERETPYGHRWIPEDFQYLIEVTEDDKKDKEGLEQINIDNIELKKEDKPEVKKEIKPEVVAPKVAKIQPEKNDVKGGDVSISINGVQIVLHNETKTVSPTVQFIEGGIKIVF